MKKNGQEMLITGQMEHKYEKGKEKRGKDKERVHRKREYIVREGEGAEGRRGQKGTRRANVKGAGGEKIRKVATKDVKEKGRMS